MADINPNKPETPLQVTYQKFWQEFNRYSAANEEFCKIFKIPPYGSICSYQDYAIGNHIRVAPGINFNSQQIRVGATVKDVDPALYFNEIHYCFEGIKGQLYLDGQGRRTTAIVNEYVEFDENHGWENVFEKLISYMLRMKEAFWKIRDMAYYQRRPNKYEIIEQNSLFQDYYLQIYFLKKNNQIYFYNIHDPNTRDQREELRNIEKDYSHIARLISGRIEDGDASNFSYVMLWDDLGRSCIKDIISGKILIDGFKRCQLQKVHKILDDENRFVNDMIFSIDKWGENDKEFFIYSLLKGYIFGPYKYSFIDWYEYGGIIDEKYVVEFHGFVKDISGYEKIDEENNVYYNKESDRWFILEDADGEFLHYLDDSNYPEIKEADLSDYRYEYNIETKKLKKQQKYISDYDRDYDRDAWDAMTDGESGDYHGSWWDLESFGY